MDVNDGPFTRKKGGGRLLQCAGLSGFSVVNLVRTTVVLGGGTIYCGEVLDSRVGS